jgi:hypothetical protein
VVGRLDLRGLLELVGSLGKELVGLPSLRPFGVVCEGACPSVVSGTFEVVVVQFGVLGHLSEAIGGEFKVSGLNGPYALLAKLIESTGNSPVLSAVFFHHYHGVTYEANETSDYYNHKAYDYLEEQPQSTGTRLVHLLYQFPF